MSSSHFHHAIKVNEDTCYGCTLCMKVCPTDAIRIWNGKAIIHDDKCIDCGECYRACPVNAIYVDENKFDSMFEFKYRVVLFPSVFTGQFPEEISISQIYSELHEIGFTHVFEVERAVEILNNEILDYQSSDNNLPIISSFCPAIVRLVQVKFPALVRNVLKLQTPSDIAAQYYKKKLLDEGVPENEIGIYYITPCAAKISVIQDPVDKTKSLVDGVINLNSLYNLVYRKIKNKESNQCILPEPSELFGYEVLWSLTKGESTRVKGRSLAIDGINNSMKFLEKIENDEVSDIDYLECRACKEGCAGGILNVQNRFLTVERLNNRVKVSEQQNNKVTPSGINDYKDYLSTKNYLKNIEPRSIMMLDPDMGKAMEKMAKAEKIEAQLPAIDCGACGSPTCKALSEDIAKGDATLSHCVFIQKVLMKNGEITMDSAFAIIEKVWGEQKKIKGSLK